MCQADLLLTTIDVTAAVTISDCDLTGDKSPLELCSIIHIGHLLALGHGDQHLVVFIHAADTQALQLLPVGGADARGEPRWEKSTSRSWGGTSSCTTPRTSIRDAANDAAVAMPFL
nr:unnamed protein product [Digitaria exilis]